MELIKVGKFLKELRNQKGLTQEQFAEKFNVSGRTVSRWENGNNMPDLDVLIEISDYYEVDLREILNGEREIENMNKETEETVLQAADYANAQAERYNKRARICIAVAVILILAYTIIRETSIYSDSTVAAVTNFAQGMAIGMQLSGLLVLSRYGARLRAFKQRIIKRQG